AAIKDALRTRAKSLKQRPGPIDELRETPKEKIAPTPSAPLPKSTIEKPLRRWWKILLTIPLFPAGGLVAATATLLLAVIIVPPLLEDPTTRALDREYELWAQQGWSPAQQWGWRLPRTSRGSSISDPRTDPERSAFLAGLSSRVSAIGTWPAPVQEQLQELPATASPCVGDQSACADRQEVLEQLGEWTLLLQSTCAHHARTDEVPSPAFWSRQDGLLKDFRDQFSKLDCTGAYCRKVQTALADEYILSSEPLSYCDLVGELMDLSFHPSVGND
ncbi:MAG: hypothetical protein KDH88_19645, partial [Chromatiales bacterium]|nr:hypothetical protein [Chromatiales bacterium]